MKVLNIEIECSSVVALCNLIVMDQCAYIWLSLEGAEPCLSNMVSAIETNYGVLSTSLIDVGNDKGCSLAQRLSKRFQIQSFVADTLPEMDQEDIRTIEMKVVEELNTIFGHQLSH